MEDHKGGGAELTLCGDTANLMRYSRVNQPTKIASVIRKNRLSSSSSVSVFSWIFISFKFVTFNNIM